MGACFSSGGNDNVNSSSTTPLNKNSNGKTPKNQNDHECYEKVYAFCADNGVVKSYLEETEKITKEKNIPCYKVSVNDGSIARKLSGEKNCLFLVFEEVSSQDRLKNILRIITNSKLNLSGVTFSIFLVGSVQSINIGNDLRIKLMAAGAKEHQKVKLRIHPIPKSKAAIASAILSFFTQGEKEIVLDRNIEEFFTKFKEHFGSPTNNGTYTGEEITSWIKREARQGVELDDYTAVGFGQKLIQYNIIRHTERSKPFLNSPKVSYELVYDKSGKPKYTPPQEWNY